MTIMLQNHGKRACTAPPLSWLQAAFEQGLHCRLHVTRELRRSCELCSTQHSCSSPVVTDPLQRRPLHGVQCKVRQEVLQGRRGPEGAMGKQPAAHIAQQQTSACGAYSHMLQYHIGR